MIVAMIALFVAMSGASYAALAVNTVGSRQLKKNSVSGVKIKKDAITAAKVKDGSLLGADFAAGQIPAGPRGEQGPPGVVGTVVVRRTDVALPAGNPGVNTSAFATCAAGEKIIGGSVNVSDATNAEVLISRPALDNIGAGGIPEDGSSFTFWKGTARSLNNVAGTARVFAICAQTP